VCARCLDVCRNFVHIIYSHVGQIAISFVTWRYYIRVLAELAAVAITRAIMLNQRRVVTRWKWLYIGIPSAEECSACHITNRSKPVQHLQSCNNKTSFLGDFLSPIIFAHRLRTIIITTDPDNNNAACTTGIPSISLDRKRRRDTADGWRPICKSWNVYT